MYIYVCIEKRPERTFFEIGYISSRERAPVALRKNIRGERGDSYADRVGANVAPIFRHDAMKVIVM